MTKIICVAFFFIGNSFLWRKKFFFLKLSTQVSFWQGCSTSPINIMGLYNEFPINRHLRISSSGIRLLLLLNHFSRVRLCATPQTAAHQASPSLGFPRQEHWSGLPSPSLMHESEKWKWSRSVVSDSSRAHGPQPTRLLRPWDFPGKSTGVGCHCLLQVLDYSL